MPLDDALLAQRRRYDSYRDALFSERSTWDADWRDLGDYFRPQRPRFLASRRNRGGRRNQKLVNSTPTFAERVLRAGMHAGMTSPARPWMKLTVPDPRLATRPAVREWLHVTTERMLAVFAGSNLYNALPEVYGDMATFGTASMGVFEDDDDLIRCYTYPIGSYAATIDNRNRPATWLREFEMTIEALVLEFGFDSDAGRLDRPDLSRFSRWVGEHWNRGHFTVPVTVLHVVERNDEPTRRAPWPILSVHLERARNRQGARDEPEDDRKLLRVKGFEEWPIMMPRWDVNGGDVYGSDCPGLVALGDAKALQVQEKRSAQAVEKHINPPLQGPSETRNQPISSVPGEMNYVDGQTPVRSLHDMRFDISPLELKIAQTEARINRAFYVDLFQMFAQAHVPGIQPRTAAEIAERHEEKLIGLANVVERTNDELLNPLIDRAYGVMERAGFVPDPPVELETVKLRVDYISLLSQALKLSSIAQTDRFFLTVQGLAQLEPSVLAKVDWLRVVDEYAELIGVDPELVRSSDEAREIIEARAREAASAQAAEEARAAAPAVKALAETDLSAADTALRRAVEGVQAQ